MKDPLVSVIIPTYNRAHLIGTTLDSLRQQTYFNWECIVIDDHSRDYTLELLEFYNQKDPRIQSCVRPKNYPKGANACRNYGFEKCIGDFIIWFDSDDLMARDHISLKIANIQSSRSDFVIAQTANFQENKISPPYRYEKKPYGITASDFILLKIHWYTYDVMLKRSIAEKVRWNEKMRSWQDYNYFCKMVLETQNGIYIDQVLTHRRLHTNSIQRLLTRDRKTFNSELLENRILTFEDIKDRIDSYTKKELIGGLMNLCFEIAKSKSFSQEIFTVLKIVSQHFGKRATLYFFLALNTGFIFKRGHFLLQKAKGKG